MGLRKIAKEIRKGTTVTGYSSEAAEHHGYGELRGISKKEMKKEEARKGSYYTEGTITHRAIPRLSDFKRVGKR